MSDVIIRPARADDEKRIGELLIDAFLTTYRKKMPEVTLSEERFAELRSVGGKRTYATVLVAEASGEVIGTVTLLPFGSPEAESFVEGASSLRYLGVDTRWHGRGVGVLLMDAIEDDARKHGVATICLHVRRGATGVARIYTVRGYERVPSGDLDLLPLVFLEAYRREL